MNERIQALIEQSTERYLDWGGENERTELNAEKLAELIVKECIWALWTEECRTSDLASEEYTRGSNKIKEHFGVKEQVNDSKELHTCPYREEIHNDYESLCDCDEEQQHQCAMDI